MCSVSWGLGGDGGEGTKKQAPALMVTKDLFSFFWCAVCPRCPLSLATEEQIGLKEGLLQIFFVLQEVKVLSTQAQNYLDYRAAWHVLTRAVVQLLVYDGFP